MSRIQTRTELLARIARLKAENTQLREALDEIADIVNDEEIEDSGSDDYGGKDFEEDDAG